MEGLRGVKGEIHAAIILVDDMELIVKGLNFKLVNRQLNHKWLGMREFTAGLIAREKAREMTNPFQQQRK